MTAGCPFCAKLADLPRSEVVAEFPHSVALLGEWQCYPGYCVLVAKTHARELHHLPEAERAGYLGELTALSAAIDAAFTPRKLNYELLGNQVEHLHWHVFPRAADDPDPLRPVWFQLETAKESPAQVEQLRTGPASRAELAERVRQHLAVGRL